MVHVLVVGLGGFIGAIARYGLSSLAHRVAGLSFPVGTLLVNVLGCFALGGLMVLIEDRESLSPNVRLFLAVGLLGSLTTFSTFGFETLELLRASRWGAVGGNILANVIVGLVAVWLGRVLFSTVGS